MAMNSVAVFGGTGFLGRAIVGELIAAGITARVAVRHPEPMKLFDSTAGDARVQSVYADVSDMASVGRAMEGCNAAVNVVGLYVEQGTDTFRNTHEYGAMHVARQSARSGVKALVHMSGIGPISTRNPATSAPAREANCWSRRLSLRPPSCAPACSSGPETSS